jgi:hypothetical protein
MVVISITATGLGPQLISGIPQLVALSTNIPATIFYTLDGTSPTVFSRVYTSAILMPTEVSARLRAWAISGADRGSLEITFSTDSSDLTYPRRIDGYGIGIAVDAYNVIPVLLDGYKPDENLIVDVPARFSDYELKDLEIQFSRTGPDGEGRGTAIVNGPIVGGHVEIDPRASSPNHQNVYFNPRSMYIVMDGTDGYEDQSVYIINRPYGSTMDMTMYLQGKSLYEPQPYISGGHVRTFYTEKDGYGLACAYYFDFNETRWIKSIQRFDLSTVPQGIGDRRQVGPPLVFKWIYNKRSMI